MSLKEFTDSIGIPIPSSKKTTPEHLLTTLARHPKLFRQWLPFGLQFMRGVLPARDRELLILRTAVRCESEYEWQQHSLFAQECGLRAAEVDRVRADRDFAQWPPADRLLLAVADEVYDTGDVTASTWEALRQRFDECQLIEMLMLLGHYRMVAMVAKALRIEIERPTGNG